MKKTTEQLEQLLAAKSFAELTPAEKQLVADHLEADEYDRLHFLAKNARRALQGTPPPRPGLRSDLLAAYREAHRPQQPGAVVRLLRARVPAWQAVAAAGGLLLAFHFLRPAEVRYVERTVTEFVHHTDTVYQEVAVAAPAPPPRINVKPRPGPPPSAADLSSVADSSLASTGAAPPDTFSLPISRPPGQSAAQTKDLWRFLGEVH